MIYVFCDSRIPEGMRKRLCECGFAPLLVSESKMLSEAVCAHADLQAAAVGKKLVVQKALAQHYPFLYECEGVFVSDELTGAQYPEETRFCVKAVGDTLYHGKAASEDILRMAQGEGLSLCEVKQGYVACSLLVLDGGHAITSDASLSRALQARGVNVLIIREGYVSLPPYPYGFIGGASGVYDKTVYFLGDIMTHPDGGKIVDFIASCGMQTVCLGEGELFDGGGLLFFSCDSAAGVGEHADNDGKQGN